MNGQRLEVARVIVEEDLGANSVAGAPGKKVHGDADGLLGLPSDITRQHGHTETLGCPKGKDDPVADEQTGSGCAVCILNSHDDNGTCESWDQIYGHSQKVLLCLLDDIDRAHEREDDNGAKNHGQKLSLKNTESESLDDDVVKSTKSRSRKRGEYLDTHVAVGLGVEKCFLELVRAKLLVLKTSLVGAYALDHQLLVFFRPALCAHRAVGKPPNNEQSPQKGDATVGDENGLP